MGRTVCDLARDLAQRRLDVCVLPHLVRVRARIRGRVRARVRARARIRARASRHLRQVTHLDV